jgi:parallel beta-helix repeat protein
MNNEFVYNESLNDAAIHCEQSSSVTLTGNVIRENLGIPDANVGAVFIDFTDSCFIKGNLITGNYPYGLFLHEVNSAQIANNIISENSPGGGMKLSYVSRARVSNNIISGNIKSLGPGYHGGGICADHSFVSLFNNTIIGNHSTTQGGGIACVYGSTTVISNTIFWGNSASQGPEIFVGTHSSPSALGIQYSTVEGGQGSVFVGDGSTLIWGDGMREFNPLFLNSEDDDYHLSEMSPCINSGNPDYVPEPDETDIDGEPREMRRRVDMGADEVPSPHSPHHQVPAQFR